LGIEVVYSKNGIFFSQRKYTMDLFEETRLLGGRAASTPLEPNLKLGKVDSIIVENERYQRMVG